MSNEHTPIDSRFNKQTQKELSPSSQDVLFVSIIPYIKINKGDVGNNLVHWCYARYGI